MTDRQRLLAKIHIALKSAKVCCECREIVFVKRCPLCGGERLRAVSEIDYRGFLKEITGKTSCKFMSNDELQRVVERFYKNGFKPVNMKKRMIFRIKKEAENRLGKNWEKRLAGFVLKRMKKDCLEKLNKRELRQVWGFVRGIKIHQEA